MATLLAACALLLLSGAQGQWTTYWPADETTPNEWNTRTPVPCGGSLFGSRGQFNSPNYPNNYPDNSDCVWTIQAPVGNEVIKLDFPFFSLEGNYGCSYDRITVYDGSSTRSRLLGKVCGKQPSSFQSTGKFMTVRFQSDGSSNYPGFRAEYQLVAEGSCLYNCGYEVGNCSCYHLCENYGNCCKDFQNHCSGVTPLPETTTQAETTPEPTHWTHNTDICRYNCGYDFGHCSCHYNCQHYGNCCHSYYEYCESTTAPEMTTGQSSCRYNCGLNLGSCSCSSSCQYYGNCCHDYSYYCPTAAPPTTEPARSCGGNLYGSGHFTSPNHPGYYYDNANCVWQLSVPAGHRVYLSFTSLELENCCNCDYVAVYDGPSVSYRLLGKLCSGNNTLDTFHSSSGYLTVVFRSDGSVVSRGFQAQFSSSLPTSTGRVDCSSDIMNIVVERSYLNSLGYDGHNMYLNDQHCRPSVSSYQVAFSFPINTCGTIRKFVNEKVVYTNTLRASPSSGGEITRQSQFSLNVECHMEQDTMVQIMYQANEVSNSTISGSGRFNGTMAFYHSSSFYNQVTEVPFKVKLNQDLFVQVSLRRSDSSLVLFLDTCVASPSPHDFQTRAYDLVRNGCRRDSTYHPYLTGTHSYARFTFKAFKFLRTHELVYLQCKVIICQASDYNSRCKRGCYSRKARSLDSNQDSHTLVLGPIQRQDFEKEGKLPIPEVEAEVKHE